MHMLACPELLQPLHLRLQTRSGGRSLGFSRRERGEVQEVGAICREDMVKARQG